MKPSITGPIFLLFVIVLAAISTGCGNRIAVAPCTGHLSLDGKPLSDCLVRFSLAESPVGLENVPAIGQTDSEGRFSMATMERSPRNGAPVGECIVMIGYNPTPPKGYMPEDYATTREYQVAKPKFPENATNGTLRFTVPSGGTKNAHIELTTPTQ